MSYPKQIRALKWFSGRLSGRDFERPIYGSYKVLHNCNLQCSFCNVWNNPVKPLTTEQAYKVIDRLADSTVTVLSLEGGEPLLRKDILDLIKYASDRSFYLFVTTNGLLLDKAPLNEFAKYLDFLHISIDEGHGNLYLLDKLKSYTDQGLKVTVQTVVTKNDVNKLREKVEKVVAANARILIMPAVTFENMEYVTPDAKEIHDVLLDLKKEYKGHIVTSMAFINAIVSDYTCHSYGLMIEANGDIVYPCSVIGKKIGNIVETDLEEILSSKEAETARNVMNHCNRHCLLYLHAETSNFLTLQNLASFIKDTVEGYYV
ncbi:MAG: radical SAM protein [Thermoplasmata archaeon]